MNAKNMFYSENKEFSNAENKAFARSELVYNVTEDILLALEDKDVSKKELAKNLGKSASFVTQVLSGSRNMTLNTLSDITYSMGVKVSIRLNYPEKEQFESAYNLDQDVTTFTTKARKIKHLRLVISKEDYSYYQKAEYSDLKEAV